MHEEERGGSKKEPKTGKESIAFWLFHWHMHTCTILVHPLPSCLLKEKTILAVGLEPTISCVSGRCPNQLDDANNKENAVKQAIDPMEAARNSDLVRLLVCGLCVLLCDLCRHH